MAALSLARLRMLRMSKPITAPSATFNCRLPAKVWVRLFAVVATRGDVDDGVAGAADVVVAEQILQERADEHIVGRLL